MAYFVVVTILAWIVIPRIVRLSYRLSHKKAQLNYQNPLIHPLFSPENYKPQGTIATRPANKRLISDIF